MTISNGSEKEIVIPAGDLFCWVSAGESKPDPLNLDQVQEACGVEDQVHGDVVEPVHVEPDTVAVDEEEAWESATSKVDEKEDQLEAEDDELQRFLQRTEEGSKEEETKEPSRWMMEEIMGPSPGNHVLWESLFKEEMRQGGYKAHKEKEEHT